LRSEQLVLACDTWAAHCAAALVCGDQVLAQRLEEMKKGQAERLMPLLQDLLHEAGKDWSDLERIGVGVGPGNFTGIRISVSCARGLALGLDIPAVGVSTFEAIALNAPNALPCVPAPREQAYLAPAGQEPYLATKDELQDLQDAIATPQPAVLAMQIAKVAQGKATDTAPAPLYIRPADAAPSREAPPVILDDA
jgi:tRNA threonylcarbamoyl adenosine modification protein YeaZ